MICLSLSFRVEAKIPTVDHIDISDPFSISIDFLILDKLKEITQEIPDIK